MEYTLTKKDVEKLLGRSGKTISRYIKSGKLNPIKKKVDGYITYLFTLDDVEEFKRGQSGHDGQDTTGQGTNEETFATGKGDTNKGRVNNLNGGTQETNEGTKQSKKNTPEDIGDRTQETKTLELLQKTIGILEKTLDNQDKVLDNQSRQIDNLTNTQQFLINEVSGYRKMLELPTAREDILNGVKDSEVVDIEDRTEDRTPAKEGTKDKTKKSRQTKTKTTNKVKTKPKDKGQSGGQKKEKDKKRGLFNWIFKS